MFNFILTYRDIIEHLFFYFEHNFYVFCSQQKIAAKKRLFSKIRNKFLAKLANHRGDFTELSGNSRAYLLADLSFWYVICFIIKEFKRHSLSSFALKFLFLFWFMIFVTLIISQILHLQVIFSNFIKNITKYRFSSGKIEQLF